MFIVISYDIPGDRRRTKVMKTLKNYGRHVQYSVFECDLNPTQYKTLQDQLKKLIDLKQDNVRFYALCQDDLKKRRVWGNERGDVEIKSWYLVSKTAG